MTEKEPIPIQEQLNELVIRMEVDRIEQEMARIEQEMAELRRELTEFKGEVMSQFSPLGRNKTFRSLITLRKAANVYWME